MTDTPAADSPTENIPTPETNPVPSVPPAPANGGYFDLLNLVLALVALFLTVSYPARNTDIWLHLASGRSVVQSGFHPGVDPFSQPGLGRVWVHNSWLHDVGLYSLYTLHASGAVVVAVKAALVAFAFLVIVSLRPSGTSRLPWVLLLIPAFLAAAPGAMAKPIIASLVCEALLLKFLFGCEWKEGSRRMAFVVGLLCLLWGNLDTGAIFGPITLLILMIGERLQPFLTRGSDAPSLFPPKARGGALIFAFILAVVGWLANPMFLGALAKNPGEALIQRLPAELGLGLPETTATDEEYLLLGMSTLSKDYMNNVSFGNNRNGAALALLTIFAALPLVLGFRSIHATHLLLWFVFALVAILHYRWVPYFCLVAIPLAASHWNGVTSALHERGLQAALAGIATGLRLCLALGTIAIGAASYPGWMLPPNHRLGWSVEVDPGFQRSAEYFHEWRQTGRLKPEEQTLNLSASFGNYLTWFAPEEKTFLDDRPIFHREELKDALRILREFSRLRQEEKENQQGGKDKQEAKEKPTEKGNPFRVAGEICEARSCHYLVQTSRRRVDLMSPPESWLFSHVDGRLVIYGKGTERMSFSPAQLAYRKQAVGTLPVTFEEMPPDDQDDLLAAYCRTSQPLSYHSQDAENWMMMATVHRAKQMYEFQSKWTVEVAQTMEAFGAVTGITVYRAGLRPVPPPLPKDQVSHAYDTLIFRSAVRGASEAPNVTEAYQVLINALQQEFTPQQFDEPLQVLAWAPNEVHPASHYRQIAAIRRILENVPPVDKLRLQQANGIGEMILGHNRTFERAGLQDMAIETQRKAMNYMLRSIEGRTDDKYTKQVMTLDAQVQQKEGSLKKVLEQIDAQKSTPERLGLAIKYRCFGKALTLLRESRNDAKGPYSEFGAQALDTILLHVQLELITGNVDRGASMIRDLVDGAKSANNAKVMQQAEQLERALHVIQCQYAKLLENKARQAPAKLSAERLELVKNLRATCYGIGGLASWELLRSTQPDCSIILREADHHSIQARYHAALGHQEEAIKEYEAAVQPQGVDLKKLARDIQELTRQPVNFVPLVLEAQYQTTLLKSTLNAPNTTPKP